MFAIFMMVVSLIGLFITAGNLVWIIPAGIGMLLGVIVVGMAFTQP